MSEKYYKLIFENPLNPNIIKTLKDKIKQVRYEYNNQEDRLKRYKLGRAIDVLDTYKADKTIRRHLNGLKNIKKIDEEYDLNNYNDDYIEEYGLNEEEKKQALQEIKKNKTLLETMIRMKTAHKPENFIFDEFYKNIQKNQGQYPNYPQLKEEDFDKYEYLFNKLSVSDLKDLLSDRLHGTEAQMEKLRDLQGNTEKKKIKLLKEQLLKAPNELEKMKLQRQIDKLKDIKHQKKLITTFNKSVNETGEKLNLDNTPLVNNTMTSSYVPKKFIPLFVKNEDGNGYHRITAAEIKKLKNDPSGDYYTGEGINRKNRAELYKYIGKDKGKMEELSGGSILGIATTLIPAGLNIAKYFLDKYTSQGQMKTSRGGRGRGNVSGEGVKHEDLKGGSNTYNAFNQNGFNIGKNTPFTGGAVYNGFNQTQFKMSKDGFFEPI